MEGFLTMTKVATGDRRTKRAALTDRGRSDASSRRATPGIESSKKPLPLPKREGRAVTGFLKTQSYHSDDDGLINANDRQCISVAPRQNLELPRTRTQNHIGTDRAGAGAENGASSFREVASYGRIEKKTKFL